MQSTVQYTVYKPKQEEDGTTSKSGESLFTEKLHQMARPAWGNAW
jgi:hypothetical protein